MHPRVRELYKELLFTASHYNNSIPFSRAREKIKAAFFKHKDLEIESPEWKKALAWGRYEIKEMKAMHEIRVYRRMKNQYDPVDKETGQKIDTSAFETPWSDLTKPKPAVPKERRGY